MLDFFVIDKVVIDTVVNTLLFQVSSACMPVLGLISGYFSHQYGRSNRKIGLIINGVVILFILALILFENFFYFSLYLFFYLGALVATGIYRYLLKNYRIGPRLYRPVETEINLDACILKYRYPLPNSENRWIAFDIDFDMDKFKAVDDAGYDYKDYLRRCWVYYRSDGEVSDGVVLKISVQKMSDYNDLFNGKCLTGAAAHYFFSNYIMPVSADEYDEDENEETRLNPISFSNWKACLINGHYCITYDVINKSIFDKKYLHIAISKNLMLTLEFKIYQPKGAETIEALVNSLVNSWSLNYDQTNLNPQLAEEIESFIPPEFDQFNEKITECDYPQMEMICEEYDSLRKDYIDAQIKKCRSMCI